MTGFLRAQTDLSLPAQSWHVDSSCRLGSSEAPPYDGLTPAAWLAGSGSGGGVMCTVSTGAHSGPASAPVADWPSSPVAACLLLHEESLGTSMASLQGPVTSSAASIRGSPALSVASIRGSPALLVASIRGFPALLAASIRAWIETP